MFTRTVDDTSNITLNYTDASATLASNASNSMTFAALVVSRKGEPNKVLSVNSENWQNVLGKPFHMREGIHAESLRHVNEAVERGVGKVVRVMPSDAKYPIITIGPVNGAQNAATASAAAYGTEPTLSEEDIAAIYLIDGDNELPRHITIEPASTDEYGLGFFELTLLETSAAGDDVVLEKHVVAFNIDAIGVDNKTAFIEDKLVAQSKRIRSLTNISKLSGFQNIKKASFTGGTSGTYSSIGTDEYRAAMSLFTAERTKFEAIIAAGCYDDAILVELKKLADKNNVSLYYDVEPNLSYEQAQERNKSLAMNSQFAQGYHLPYRANDPFYGGTSLYGLSGFVFAAKAKGVSLKSPTGGWHITPAGEDHATITRPGLTLNTNAGECDEQAFVNARLNKLGLNSLGQLMIDDALTTRARKDDLRFDNIVSVDNAIGRDYVALCASLKHSPDGITLKGLKKGMKKIFEGYVASGCLVKPRNPANGESPYKFNIRQLESDLWEISWSMQISGSSRRFIGKPRLY